jgi:predicted PurR-regulated permease PerM
MYLCHLLSGGGAMIGFLKNHEKLVFVALIVTYFLLIYALRSVLYPFIIGLVLAYIFLPIIKWIDRKMPKTQWHWQKRRALTIGITYLCLLLLFIGFTVYLFASMRPALVSLETNAPNLYTSAYDNIVAATDKFTDLLFNLLPSGLHEQIDQFIYNFGLNAINSIVQNFSQNNNQLGVSAIGALLGIAIMPVFLFYILKDWEFIEKAIYSGVPVWAGIHIKNIVGIVDTVMGRYIRAQVMLGGVVGLLTLVGLIILRIPFAPLLALIAGFMEMVPTVGPWISGIIAILVTAALAPAQVGWVVLLVVGIQIVENIFLVPRIQSKFMHLHPALVMVLLVVGMFLAGIWGFILVLPLAAASKEVYRYFRNTIGQTEKQPEVAFESMAIEKNAIYQRESNEVGPGRLGREQITDN